MKTLVLKVFRAGDCQSVGSLVLACHPRTELQQTWATKSGPFQGPNVGGTEDKASTGTKCKGGALLLTMTRYSWCYGWDEGRESNWTGSTKSSGFSQKKEVGWELAVRLRQWYSSQGSPGAHRGEERGQGSRAAAVAMALGIEWGTWALWPT